MITNIDLKQKIARLMAMAGTEGSAYCEWTVNQLVHGLRDAVVGATQERIEHAIEELVEEGHIRKYEREGRGKAQFVLTRKMPPPEPINQSPVVLSDLPPGIGKAGGGLGSLETRRAEADAQDLQDAFAEKQRLQILFGRVDNFEEVMSTLNDTVAGVKDEQKTLRTEQERVRSDLRGFKLDDSRLSRLRTDLEARVAKIDKRVDGLVGLIESAVDRVVEDASRELNDRAGDGVQVVESAIRDDRSITVLSEHWTAIADKLTDDTPRSSGEMSVNEGAAQAYRKCADDLKQVLAGTMIVIEAGKYSLEP